LVLFRQTLKNSVVQEDKKARAEIILIITALKACSDILSKLILRLQRRVD